MGYLEAVVLGFIQGATEFLPISSSGHLTIFPALFGWQQPSLSFDIFVHAGTLVAVLIYFWADIAKYFKALFVGLGNFFKKEEVSTDSKIAFYIVLSFIPAAILGYLLESRIELLINSPKLVSYFFLVTAGLLILATVLKGKKEITGINWLDAIFIGFAQAIALIPGVSRSGTSITAGRIMGMTREASARFAFLIAVPAIAGGFLYHMYKAVFKIGFVIDLGPSLVGFAVAAVIGWLSIYMFFKILKTAGFEPYIVYLIILFVVLQIVL